MTTVNYSNILRQPIYTTLQYTTVDMITKISKKEWLEMAKANDEIRSQISGHKKKEYTVELLWSMK
jgi:hypothetical protein